MAHGERGKLNASRRRLLKMAGALPAAAAFSDLGGLSELVATLTAQGRHINGHNPAFIPDTRTLGAWLQQLHDFGPIRMTGTRECRAFEEWLAQQFAAIGFTVERDQYRLTSWECRITDCSVSVKEDSGATKNVEVVSYYPFGGSTKGKPAVSGRVLYVPGIGADAAKTFADKTDPATLAASIVIVDMPLRRTVTTPALVPAAAATRAEALPRFPAQAPPRVGGLSPAGQGGREIMEIFENRCKGLILCYTDVSNDTARHTYLPFSDQHRATPAVWIGAEGSKYLQSISGKATITMRCDATLTPDSRADTILATLKGRSDEVVFLTTQTDGPNEVNENGGLGVLALATFWSKLPAASRTRTLVCSLPTGHYASGAILDKVTGSGRRAGTRGVLEKWPEVAKRIVAQMAMEQMAAMEWADLNGTYMPTNQVAPQRWISTPSTLKPISQMFVAATSDEDPRWANAVITQGGAPGEGGSLRTLELPGFGLMGQPSYFFRADPKGVLEKLSPDVMHTQLSIMSKLMVLMDRLTPAQLHGTAPITDADLF